ncbi:prepilin-type N-terminal cleavage/methylation domain-containing protein [Paraglaciecola aquimarina]|uniref:Type II secretion system protein H n=1 Tax=Paraglaciecola algarum TaxID=3050085 RepID=A0ABS9D601_9ALTE|nr:GspH/FimT family pseudopilin [Paraglaciecola sp. G1-23]MCF2948344.1 prepilin-type N-terminal cleavage/methylation domain-containing protein [Paraglaciecola sp. G1-23]
MFKHHGLTLLELLVTVSVVVLLVMLASPSYTAIQKNIQLKAVVENHYFALQQARYSAISHKVDVGLFFKGGKKWCAGLSDKGKCDCLIVNNCTLDGVEQLIRSQDYSFITLTSIKFGQDSAALFDGVRGLSIGHAGSLIFSDGRRQLKLILSNMGRIRICGVNEVIGGYEKC